MKFHAIFFIIFAEHYQDLHSPERKLNLPIFAKKIMHTQIQLILTPEQAEKQELLIVIVAEALKTTPKHIDRIRTVRKSIDARSFQVKINLTVVS